MALFMDTHTSGGRGTFAWDPRAPRAHTELIVMPRSKVRAIRART